MANVSLDSVKLGLTYRELIALLNTNFSAVEQAVADTGDITSLIAEHNVAADAHADLVANMITGVALSDQHDGVLTFTRKDGSTFTIDTMLEKVVTNFSYNEETGNIELTQDDGTVKTVSLSRFVDTYIGTQEGDSVQIRVSIDSATKKISATIEDGVIVESMLGAELAAKINNKVDKVDGMGLSSNDYTTAEKEKLSGIEAGANKTIVENVLTSDSESAALSAAQGKELKRLVDAVDESLKSYDKDANGQVDKADDADKLGGQLPEYYAAAANIPTKVGQLENDKGYLTEHQDISGKVDKVDGMGLSTNDYSNADKEKLAGVEAGAQVNKIEVVKVNGVAQEITDKAVDISVPTGALASLDIVAEDNLDAALKEKVNAAAEGTHSHANKALLDTYTQTEADLADAVAKKHAHTFNEAELNKIADGDVAKWNAAEKNAKDYADSLAGNYDAKGDAEKAQAAAEKHADDLNTAMDARMQTVEGKAHEHANKEVIDGIDAAKVASWDNKVDKVDGKGLSTEDYTTAEKEKLAGIAEGANNYVLPIAGDELGGVKNGGNVVVGADGTLTAGSRIAFTADDARWAEGSDGEYILTVATTAVPLMVMKQTEASTYEQVVVQADITATGFRVVSHSKFAGIVICM